ncbi:MAG: phytoene dehydrogenase, partial [Acidimicrobiia bacterium]|nr:phytoene dehydrogenase [Acidimicrobiia bacterium]
RATFADGSTIHIRRGHEAMAEEIRTVVGPAAAAGFERFTVWLRRLYEAEFPNFIDRNFNSSLDLVRPAGPGLALLRLGAFGRLSGAVARYFDDERLRRLFSFQSLYAGLAPQQALAVYAVITYMDSVEGVYFPEGGIARIADGLASAATKAGAVIRYDSPVDQIVLANGSDGPVQGVRLSAGEFIDADVVVCNANVAGAYRSLLPGLAPPRRVQRAQYSPSALVWHAGMRGPAPSEAAHHNIHFGAQWEESFRQLLQDGTFMSDPSLLVSVPTQSDPTLAPPGRHVIYALEPVPNLDASIRWESERERRKDRLAQRLADLGYSTDVETEALWDPTDWQREGSDRGTPFSISHRFLQSGPFRPSNVERRAPGLVFVGASTVPGVGVPMVLLSGRLAAERAMEVLL